MDTKFRDEDIAPLFKKYKQIKHDTCIACGSPEHSVWSENILYGSQKCTRCGLIWMDPILEEAGLNEYYSDYIGKRRINNLEKMRQREVQYGLDARIIRRFLSRGKLLDVGCNGGFFLNAFGGDFERHGIELDPQAVAYAKTNFPEFGDRVDSISLSDVTYDSESFDLITMRGVIEHVPEPENFIAKVSDLLKSGGYYYICATPNGGCLAAEVFRENWTLFHPVQHIWHFNPENLALMCGRHGLKLIWQEFPYLNTPYEKVAEDTEKMSKAMQLRASGQSVDFISPPFFENMLALVFQKQT